MLIIHYLVTVITALLTLTLFDSNPWWIVLIYSGVATILNYWLFLKTIRNGIGLFSLAQGILAAFLAYLFGLTPLFRTTFGTLVGYTLLLALAQYLLGRFKSANSREGED